MQESNPDGRLSDFCSLLRLKQKEGEETKNWKLKFWQLNPIGTFCLLSIAL